MRFNLIDRIVELVPGERVAAVKALTMAEEYLADHFPRFPVMPGVLMLEAMTQAGAWLVRATEDFAHSMVVLKQVTNIKYGQFVVPGQVLTVRASIVKMAAGETKLRAEGSLDGRITVSGQLVLAQYNLADADPDRTLTDRAICNDQRRLFSLIYHPEPSPSPPATDATRCAANANGEQANLRSK